MSNHLKCYVFLTHFCCCFCCCCRAFGWSLVIWCGHVHHARISLKTNDTRCKRERNGTEKKYHTHILYISSYSFSPSLALYLSKVNANERLSSSRLLGIFSRTFWMHSLENGSFFHLLLSLWLKAVLRRRDRIIVIKKKKKKYDKMTTFMEYI